MPHDSAQEFSMRDDDFMVSKTDPKGRLTYGNRTFIEYSGKAEKQLLNKPHNIVRHPDMPHAIFRYMWNTLQQGGEFFGLIKNNGKNGRYYWTFAHVTPSYTSAGELLGYYSVRRRPRRALVDALDPLYRRMREVEEKQGHDADGMDASFRILEQHIHAHGKNYNEFILSLQA